jgi:hypothetical protein
MAWLSEPVPDVHPSFLAAMAEFRPHGRGHSGDRTMLGDDIGASGSDWARPAGFAEDERDGRLRFWVPTRTVA